MRRLLDAVCELIEAHAERVRAETLELEMDAMVWAGADHDD